MQVKIRIVLVRLRLLEASCEFFLPLPVFGDCLAGSDVMRMESAYFGDFSSNFALSDREDALLLR